METNFNELANDVFKKMQTGASIEERPIQDEQPINEPKPAPIMKRFLLSSPKLNVSAEVWFNEKGLLCRVDLVNSIIDKKQLTYLLSNLTQDEHVFRRSIKASLFKVREKQVTVDVEEFLHIYPYARNSHLVRDWWPKQVTGLHIRVYFAGIDYREYCQRNPRYKPKIAMQWIKDKEYLNDWKVL
ncbi:hypothetical protein LWM68_40815 [Niabella sp. W65]|nr:hypothetical protein [Niabella sp. W65]MCH7368516.1 hypothetical protein [Niabella sp. W65]ULT44105.1 hypothetical protein KRR40_12510 [Niabella sp. I65]